MSDFAALYPIPLAVAKDRHVAKLAARTDAILEQAAGRVEVFSIRGASFLVPEGRLRPGAVLHVLPSAPAATTIILPPALAGVWLDLVNRSVFTATLAADAADTIGGAATLAVPSGGRRRLVVVVANTWGLLASS